MDQGVTVPPAIPLVVPLDPFPEPLELLERFVHWPAPVLLEGAADQHDLGRYSYFSAGPVALLRGFASDWPELSEQLRRFIRPAAPLDPALPPFQGGWIGWFGYELGAAFDRMPRAATDPLALPDCSLALHDWVIAWDHVAQRAWLVSSGVDASGECSRARAESRAAEVLAVLRAAPVATPHAASAPTRVSADFTADGYRTAVATVVEHVLSGEIFQANLAQRFTAPFAGTAVALYRRVRDRSAASLAAYLDQGDVQLVSASPERFLELDAATGRVETRPIKGTRPRGRDAAHDAALAAELLTSEKERAENVMIVDLLRNDLARVCAPHTVEVPALCVLESHPTVHHLVSTVTGTLREGRDAMDLLAATFPGGSITGAPKLRAMAVIAELEPVTRGPYCGAIGWIGRDGSMQLSIAIRTITLAQGIASVHAGGGITALSEPDAEYRETLDKAAALIAALEEGA
jgi:para-aminobenzoate synthetase component 1